ncbi:MAG: hypothetical protein H7A53_07605 [Akkermansiaceae bacterium]|nr:hypothetical protein [Akkermansiaceae bacterium]MCP5550739.1 hypothetical protein [Akkermansiaceae bacterium]
MRDGFSGATIQPVRRRHPMTENDTLSPEASPVAERWLPAVLLGIVLAGGVAVFAQIGGFKFVQFDDPPLVTGNPYVASGLTLDSAVWAFTFREAPGRPPVEPMARELWAPLSFLSHALDVSLLGGDPGRHHLMSLALHLAATALVFALILGLSARPFAAALVAAVFCFHPMRVESVAWISERKDVLSGLFVLGALNLHALGARRPELAGRWFVKIGTPLLFLLACLAKPTVLVAPVLMLLIDGWFARRGRDPGANGTGGAIAFAARKIREKWPLWTIAILVAGVTIVLNRLHGHVADGAEPGLGDRLARLPAAIAFYLERTVWPARLFPVYPGYPRSFALGTVLGIAALAGLTALAWRGRAAFPEWLFGWLWFLVCLAPVLGIVHAGDSFTSDRYTYLAHIGLSYALAGSLARLMDERKKLAPLLLYPVLAVVFALGIAAHRVTRYWRDSTWLFERGARVQPDSAANWSNLGAWLAMTGNPQRGIYCLREAVRLGGEPEALYNLADTLRETGDGELAEIVALYRDCLSQNPEHAWAMRDLGRVLLEPAAGEFHDPEEGAALLEKAAAWFAAQGRADEAAAVRASLPAPRK